MEEQATDAIAMSNTTAPIEDSSSDNFGTFSAFETAASSDISPNDDGFPDDHLEENAPAAAPPLPSAMISSSSLNEDEFFDAPFETASMNQMMSDTSKENVEDETATEILKQPEVDLFSSAEEDVIIPPDSIAAAESEGGPKNINDIADNSDPFSAFDGIMEGGDEHNEASHLNQQDVVGFGEFEGTVSGSSNNNADMSPSNGESDSPIDTSEPVAVQLKEESACPESGENSPPVNHSTEETHATISSEGAVPTFDSHTLSEGNAAFDAFADIQDVPLPPFGSVSTGAIEEAEGNALALFVESEPNVAPETTTIEGGIDNFGEFAGISSLENATDGESNNEDKVAATQNNTTAQEEEEEDTEIIETTPEEEEAALVLETSTVGEADDNDNVLGNNEETADTSDAFGAVPAPSLDDTEMTCQAGQDVADNTALVTEAIEENAAFGDAETEDNFGEFSAPNEQDLPNEENIAFTEVNKTPVENAVEESDAFGDFTASNDNMEMDTGLAEGVTQTQESDFGEFAAPPVEEDEALAEEELPVEEDVGLAEQDAHLPEGGIGYNEQIPPVDDGTAFADAAGKDTDCDDAAIGEEDDFGDFSAPIEEDLPVEIDTAFTEVDKGESENAAEESVDFGGLSAPVEVESGVDTTPVASEEVESNNFGDFTTPIEESTTPVETTANGSDEFGDFGGFSSPAIESGSAANAPEGANEDFGNFGDFSAPVEAETENNEEKTAENHEPVDVEEDDFGEFGDFAAFEEATPTDHQPTAQVEENATEVVSAEEDEFGDFGDFEESEEVVESRSEKEPSGPAHVLNENVRAMFQKVFHVDNPVDSDKEDGCVQLPFDVPMSTVLAPCEPNTEEKGEDQIYKSEKEIKDITDCIQSLPASPPAIILSEEKWYPYSQYVFHRDGMPYTGKANLMGVAPPSVPEVLSIELPTGFDASNLSQNASASSNTRCTTPPVQSVRPTATMVDFPSANAKMSEEDVKEAAEDDEFSKLSATGKKFMEKLPDLSYMLQPNLSTVKS